MASLSLPSVDDADSTTFSLTLLPRPQDFLPELPQHKRRAAGPSSPPPPWIADAVRAMAAKWGATDSRGLQDLLELHPTTAKAHAERCPPLAANARTQQAELTKALLHSPEKREAVAATSISLPALGSPSRAASSSQPPMATARKIDHSTSAPALPLARRGSIQETILQAASPSAAADAPEAPSALSNGDGESDDEGEEAAAVPGSSGGIDEHGVWSRIMWRKARVRTQAFRKWEKVLEARRPRLRQQIPYDMLPPPHRGGSCGVAAIEYENGADSFDEAYRGRVARAERAFFSGAVDLGGRGMRKPARSDRIFHSSVFELRSLRYFRLCDVQYAAQSTDGPESIAACVAALLHTMQRACAAAGAPMPFCVGATDMRNSLVRLGDAYYCSPPTNAVVVGGDGEARLLLRRADDTRGGYAEYSVGWLHDHADAVALRALPPGCRSKVAIEAAANAPGAGWQPWEPSSAAAASMACFVPLEGLAHPSAAREQRVPISLLLGDRSNGLHTAAAEGLIGMLGFDVDRLTAGELADFFTGLCRAPECAEGVAVALHALLSGAEADGSADGSAVLATAQRTLDQLGGLLAQLASEPAVCHAIETALSSEGLGCSRRARELARGTRGRGAGRRPAERGALASGAIRSVAKVDRAPFDAALSEVWRPRIGWGDSGSLFDTDRVRKERFNLDWDRALDLGVSSLIMRYDDDAFADDDGDGVPDEVVEVGTALWLSSDLLEMLFTFYATRTADSLGRADIGAIDLNQWSAFSTDFGLVAKRSKFCKRADLDRIFLAVDGMSARKEKEAMAAALQAGYGKKAHIVSNAAERAKALNRVEFMTALVQLALHKYVFTKELTDVSDAVTRLLEVDIRSRASALHDPDAFRRQVCYRQDVTEFLGSHLVRVERVECACGWLCVVWLQGWGYRLARTLRVCGARE